LKRDQILDIFKIQNGGRSPCWKIFEMPYLADQLTNWDATWVGASHHVLDMSAVLRLPWQQPLPSNGATWVVTSHHVPDMSAMMWLPWQRPLPSNGAAHCIFSSYGRLELKFGTQQQIMTSMTVT